MTIINRIITIIIIFFVFQLSFGQDCPNFFKSENGKDIIKKNKIKKCLVYHHSSILYFFWTKSYTIDEFIFDKNANIIQKNNYWDIDDFRYSEHYKYDEKNQLVESYWYRNGKKSMIESFVYEKNRLIEVHSSGWHTIIKYDSLDNIIEEFVYNDKKHKNKYDSSIYADRLYVHKYVFDDKKRKIEEVITYNGDFFSTIKYDTLGRMTILKKHGTTNEYKYNDQNQIIDKNKKYDKTGKLKKDRGKNYFYDKTGKITKMILKNNIFLKKRDEPLRKKFTFEYEEYKEK